MFDAVCVVKDFELDDLHDKTDLKESRFLLRCFASFGIPAVISLLLVADGKAVLGSWFVRRHILRVQ